jgi:hypothetical protein
LNNLIFQSKQNIFFSSEKSAQAFSPYLKGVNSQLISFCFYQSFSVLGGVEIACGFISLMVNPCSGWNF